jgi:hypothetical protein
MLAMLLCGLWLSKPADHALVIPTWQPVTIAAAIAAAPWLRLSKQFTLRTLFIATTVVAVVLGLIVAVLRWPAG